MATKLLSKKSLLLTRQILELLVNTLAADETYHVLNWDNLIVQIQMQLSHKQKNFSVCFDAFSKSRLSFESFESKNDPHSFSIFEITDSENVVR